MFYLKNYKDEYSYMDAPLAYPSLSNIEDSYRVLESYNALFNITNNMVEYGDSDNTLLANGYVYLMSSNNIDYVNFSSSNIIEDNGSYYFLGDKKEYRPIKAKMKEKWLPYTNDEWFFLDNDNENVYVYFTQELTSNYIILINEYELKIPFNSQEFNEYFVLVDKNENKYKLNINKLFEFYDNDSFYLGEILAINEEDFNNDKFVFDPNGFISSLIHYNNNILTSHTSILCETNKEVLLSEEELYTLPSIYIDFGRLIERNDKLGIFYYGFKDEELINYNPLWGYEDCGWAYEMLEYVSGTTYCLQLNDNGNGRSGPMSLIENYFSFKLYKENDEFITLVSSPYSIVKDGNNVNFNTQIACKFKTSYIDDYMFSNSQALVSIKIPSGVTSIGEWAFYGCRSLTSIEIPSGVTSIGSGAFGWCESLTNVTFAEGSQLTSIGDNAFNNCSSLTSIEIPSSVTSIDASAFSNCSGLTNVTFAEGSQLTSIGSQAFNYCSGLTSIEIPSGVTSISQLAFQYCSGLTNVTFAEESQLTSIDYGAFQYCSSLTSIEIPSSVTTIVGAFSNCSGLTNVTFAEESQLTSIGDYAFENCSSLTSITCHALTAPTVKSTTFYNIARNGTLYYPIGSDYSSWLKTSSYYLGYYGWNVVKLGEATYKVKILLDGEFSSSDTVVAYGTTFTYDSESESYVGVINVTSSLINSTTVDKNIYINDESYGEFNLSKVEQTLLLGDNSSRSDVMTVTYTTTSANAKVTLYSGLTYDVNSLGTTSSSHTFNEVGKHTVQYYKEGGFNEIGYATFRNCSDLTSIKIPSGVTSIGGNAFVNCNSLTSIEIPSGVTSIGDNAFAGCHSLTSIEIPSGVTSIGRYAFSECRSLSSIEIPSGVTSIDNGTFNICSSLTSITCNALTAPTVKYDTFESVASNGTLYYPIGSDYSSWLKTSSYYLGYYGWNSFGLGEATYKVKILLDGEFSNSDTVVIYGVNFTYDYASESYVGVINVTKDLIDSTVDKNLYINGESYGEFNLSKVEQAFMFGDNSSRDDVITVTYTTTSANESVTLYNSLTYDVNSLGTTSSSHTFNEVGEHTVQYYKIDGFNTIGDSAFQSCRSLTSINIPSRVTSIGKTAFYGCTILTSVTFAEGLQLTSIDYAAFYNCYSLTSIEIPSSVTSIGNNTFTYCSGLTSIEIPSGVTTIGNGVFQYCSGLTNVTFAEGSQLISIGNYTFDYCKKLTSITSWALTAPTIQDYTFRNIAFNGTLYYPKGSDYSRWLNNATSLGFYYWTSVEIGGSTLPS